MQYFIFFFWLIFGIVNLQIILGDLKQKKIYNKYLLSLLGLGCIYFFTHEGASGDIYSFLYFFLFALLVGFTCYYFSLLGAGDIKYVLILGLFIYPISYLVLISNIAIISLPWLLYSLVKKEKILYLQKQINKKIHSFSFKKLKQLETFIPILQFLNAFFILFLLIKVGKIYIFQILSHMGGIYISLSMMIVISFIVTIGIINIGKSLWEKITEIINHKYGIYKDSLKVIGVSILFFLLVGLIYREYTINKEILLESMYKILTLYLLLYLSMRIVFLLYKSIYDESEKILVHVSELQQGDKIDTKFFQELLLPEIKNLSTKKKEVLESLSGSLDKNEIQILQEFYRSENKKIKIYKTIHFSQNIFLGFCMTWLWGDAISQEIIKHFSSIVIHLGG